MTDDKRHFAALLRTDLASFMAKTFHTVNPGTPYLPNWHIDAIAEYLMAATKGEITRLVINMPPRSMKSLCVSVAWPAWLLGHDPSSRIMAASYSQILSMKHSLDCRLVVTSPWYKHLFPHMVLAHDQNEKNKFATTKRGFRFATSVGGTATGEGGNFLIVDDPHTPLQVLSDTLRRQAVDWFHQTFMSRLDDKQRGVVAVVMQRLHSEDLTGDLLQHSGHVWEHLCLPAIAENRMVIQVGSFQKIREQGDILHPNREGATLIAQAKEELGSYAFAAQYQQNPVPQEGGLVKPAWICRYHSKILDEMVFTQVVQSWDTAIKATERSDYSVCTTWGIRTDGFYLLDVLRQRLEYPELKHQLVLSAMQWQAEAVLIEEKASGQMLLQDMRRETNLPVIAITPKQDKVTRFASVTPLFEAGRVFFPYATGNIFWLAELERELFCFPSSPHDDQVDSISQFLQWIKGGNGGKYRIRSL